MNKNTKNQLFLLLADIEASASFHATQTNQKAGYAH